jgi:hypothetical protein
MDGACSTHGGDYVVHTTLWLESLKGRDHSEDLDGNERIILKWVFEN